MWTTRPHNPSPPPQKKSYHKQYRKCGSAGGEGDYKFAHESIPVYLQNSLMTPFLQIAPFFYKPEPSKKANTDFDFKGALVKALPFFAAHSHLQHQKIVIPCTSNVQISCSRRNMPSPPSKSVPSAPPYHRYHR